jgi:hypothetical protein
MMDRNATGLEERIIRTLNAKAAQLDDLNSRTVATALAPMSGPRWRHRPRRTVVLLVAMLILVIVGATVAVAESRYSVGSGVDGAPSRAQAARLAQEKKDYDPAEIQFLLNEVGGASHTNDQELVGILEFRRACREALRALTTAGSVSAKFRAGTVDAIMGPELKRLVDREPSDSQASQMFQTLADEIKAGDTSTVDDWLQGPRGNCTMALEWRP